MGTKGNVAYLDKELVAKSRELGFNLSKTFENNLRHLIIRFSPVNLENKTDNAMIGSPGEIRTLVGGSKARYA